MLDIIIDGNAVIIEQGKNSFSEKHKDNFSVINSLNYFKQNIDGDNEDYDNYALHWYLRFLLWNNNLCSLYSKRNMKEGPDKIFFNDENYVVSKDTFLRSYINENKEYIIDFVHRDGTTINIKTKNITKALYDFSKAIIFFNDSMMVDNKKLYKSEDSFLIESIQKDICNYFYNINADILKYNIDLKYNEDVDSNLLCNMVYDVRKNYHHFNIEIIVEKPSLKTPYDIHLYNDKKEVVYSSCHGHLECVINDEFKEELDKLFDV